MSKPLHDQDPQDAQDALDALRSRLGELADETPPALSDAARAKIIGTVRREGPAMVRASQSQRYFAAGTATLAVAAAVGLAFIAAGRSTGPSDPMIAGADHRACEEWTRASAEAREGVMDLGPRGVVTVTGTAQLEAIDPCLTNVVLDGGRVDVRADDLGGGMLRVEAGPVQVEVWGTEFSVARDGLHIEVAVTEGHVVVTDADQREVHLWAGEHWSRDEATEVALVVDEHGLQEPQDNAQDNAQDSAQDSAQETASPTSSAAPHQEPAQESDAATLLGRAETLWRNDEHRAATRLFREVGRRSGAVAEAAWVRLARLHLRDGNPRGALTALSSHRRRFGDGRLGAEALWLEVDAHRRLGNTSSAERASARLRRAYPSSPQARAAARSLGAAEDGDRRNPRATE